MSVCQRTFCLAGLLLGLTSTSVVRAEQSDDSALMQVHSEHALNAIFGLPGAAVRPVQSSEWQLSLEHGNQFIGSTAGDETLFLDGETSELVVRRRQRLSSCWQGELVLPFFQHSSGKFDRAIDDWHQFFGLPDASRDEFPHQQLTYTYSDASGERLRVDTAQSGVGDISVTVQRTLSCQATADTTGAEPIVRAGIKLPTGSVSELRGSGRVDTFVDIQSPVMSNGGRWRAGVSLGVLYAGDNERLPSQRNLVVFGTAGSQFRLAQRYRAMVQLDWHTPFYRSDLPELNDPTVVLSAGLRFLLGATQTLELSISEDVAVETAPDIVARLAWTYRPSP
ncbi:DUF3187 family protein [Granulosicoccus sp. 3-233]|uniref:DUF3187 family protein n=1 Tax=Granulosicoccus sp. 3-233 TaxID=3417969 RepID=UPI003D34AC8F